MQPITLSRTSDRPRLLLTCEHASPAVPDEYDALGLTREQLGDHISWDIGAAAVTGELSCLLGAPGVLSGASRLLVDCNRDLDDADLIPHASHGVVIPGNAALDTAERARRLARFYDPYHAAIDAELSRHADVLLLSVHSFTPELNGCVRAFDVGVLFDGFDDLAHGLARSLTASGFSVRMNEPYSALDGLIFSPRSHGLRHGVQYLELEINNRLLRTDAQSCAIARRLRNAVASTAAVATADHGRRPAIGHRP